MNLKDFENRSVNADLPLFPIKVLADILPFAYSTLRGYVRRYQKKGIEVCSKEGPPGTPQFYMFSVKQVGMYIYRTDKVGPPEYAECSDVFPQNVDYAEIGFNTLLSGSLKNKDALKNFLELK